jgi:hypothetical protein
VSSKIIFDNILEIWHNFSFLLCIFKNKQKLDDR